MKSPFAAVAALVLVAGCTPGTENATEAANDSPIANIIAPRPEPSKSPDQTFVDSVASLNAYIAGAGSLAEQKGTSARVKAFGKKLMLDRTQSTMKLKLAAATQPDLLIDASLDDEQNDNIATLQKANGAAFDTALKAQMVVALTKLEALLKERYLANEGDPELKSFASYGAPPVRANLAAAKAL
ncbi:DUF4142 domain-containing protein [Sphingomonas cannabina]|uniref:DUF4142 domain-containing protein n=1 Tax=Sphingomonas cannabina TaxID=2899123 RepID=UPI001F483DC3|nr:DUF4142 domain-containing protein [Sphingomonas cannabina]UIJ44962.1 DUF4142 domain-containing protein [Sphingomonas cannabina]